MTVADLFAAAGLVAQGPKPWREPLENARPGVYVVALVPGAAEAAPAAFDLASLPPDEFKRWMAGQPVIYVGRATRSLRGRLEQFYRHTYGESAPHRGGQAVLLLTCPLWVYWAATDSPVKAEGMMLDDFCKRVGRLPYANRRR
jgi:hypothetical protein